MSLSSWSTTLEFAFVYAIFGLSMFAALSTGVLSVASIAFGAIGGFGFAWLSAHTGIPRLAVLAIAAVIGGVLGYLLSIPFRRLDSHYMAMATIALLLITQVVVLNATSLTGGASGMSVPDWYGWGYVLGTFAVWAYVFARLRSSRLGLAATVVREDPLVASGLGIDPRAVHGRGFWLSGAIGSTAGVLLASLLQYIDSSTFYLNLAFVSLAAVVLGSSYRWPGALVGAVVFTALPQILGSLVTVSMVQLVQGVLIVAIMVFLPGGVYDPDLWRNHFQTRRRRSGAVAPELHRPARRTEHLETPPAENRATGAAVEARGLTKSFGGLHALKDVSITVERGQLFGILGPNGAGKTTCLNVLSGVLFPDVGSIALWDQDVTRWPAYRRTRRGMARTYQNIRLPPGLTTLEAVVAGAFTQGTANLPSIIAATPSERRERRRLAAEARSLLDVVGVRSPPDQQVRTLPYGEQRRVEIARALASRPSVLLLDEPTAGMNQHESASLGELFQTLAASGLTIILVEHNLKLIADYCQFVTVMHSGSVLASGTPKSCLARPDVQEAYFGKDLDAQRIQALRHVRTHSSS